MFKISGLPGASGIGSGMLVVHKNLSIYTINALGIHKKHLSCTVRSIASAGTSIFRRRSKAKIFKAYIMLLNDPALWKPIFELVARGMSSESALNNEVERLSDIFAGMKT